MLRNKNGPLLAIGLDAAEPTLIRQMIEQDEMPVLKSLLADGRWLRVKSPALIGSGAVWPTFAIGEEPLAHGVYGEWCWQSDSMSLVRYDGFHHQPFWKILSEKGFLVGVLDPPLTGLFGLTEGFEIVDWGAHDPIGTQWQAGPADVANLLAERAWTHPFTLNRHDNVSADDPRGLEKLGSACLKGVKLRGALARTLLANTRPDFALIVFPEIHHGAHYLWHDGVAVKPSVKEILREIDRQIGTLIETTESDDSVLVFSLHGMRSTAGVPAFLESLLCEKGFARVADWKMQSWSARARSLMAAAKRHTPSLVKKLYYQTLTPGTTKYLAGPTMLPPYDWARTRAFSLPTDQHGWIRINLQDRESAGIVPPSRYDDTCRELEGFLRELTTKDGRALVQGMMRTAADLEAAGHSKLPDLVVHWADAAFAEGASIRHSAVKVQTICRKFTGQHAPDGFCIVKGQSNFYEKDELPAKDMHSLIAQLLGEHTAPGEANRALKQSA